DGHTATQKIRKLPDPAGTVPIIAMTAHAAKGFRDRCIEAGMDGYISKPIQPAELFRTLEELCRSTTAKC
ncbi:MAG TPA: response regulator, partial [Thermoguttaceae bacterium]|nr:response regulator [Thermoguttaceae bacterium]